MKHTTPDPLYVSSNFGPRRRGGRSAAAASRAKKLAITSAQSKDEFLANDGEELSSQLSQEIHSSLVDFSLALGGRQLHHPFALRTVPRARPFSQLRVTRCNASLVAFKQHTQGI